MMSDIPVVHMVKKKSLLFYRQDWPFRQDIQIWVRDNSRDFDDSLSIQI